MKKLIIMFVIPCVVFGEQITLRGLLGDMTDREVIAEYPEQSFLCKQVSSYDRKSVEPGGEGWFANDDWSNFIRCEEVDGRREWVMMDQAGPGVIVRWWITGFKFSGVIRVYLDGSDKPVFMGKADELIGGDVLLGAPLNAERSKGRNLYLPIPFSKHVKLTYDGVHARESHDFNDNIYYNINYRQYPTDTKMKTFTMADFKANSAEIAKVQRELLRPAANRLESSRKIKVKGGKATLGPNESKSLSTRGSGAICSLRVRVGADNLPQAMRSMVISMEFDGKQTVWVPVGEFFGTGVGLNAYKGWWREVDEDGWMSCYWPMPFRKGATIKMTNFGSEDITVEVDDVEIADWKWTSRTMYFNSAWRGRNGIPVIGGKIDQMEDWNYITIKGKGVYVGDTLAIFNRSDKWWGEGDEKIFVDGEKMPSHFGTGSEDYFGYAWCSPDYFTAPFHAQPNGAGNNSRNHATNTRVRLLDGIPFNRSIQVDMELWHWETTTIDYATTTYWYALDGARGNGETSGEKVAEKVGLLRDVYEGESVQLRKVSGGFSEAQKGDWGTSGGEHLWWRHGKVGDELAIAFNVAQAGEHEVKIQMITAADYGRFKVLIDGKELIGAEDFYAPQGVNIKQLVLGKLKFTQGEHILSFILLEKNPKAQDGNMLGIDYIELNKAD